MLVNSETFEVDNLTSQIRLTMVLLVHVNNDNFHIFLAEWAHKKKTGPMNLMPSQVLSLSLAKVLVASMISHLQVACLFGVRKSLRCC